MFANSCAFLMFCQLMPCGDFLWRVARIF